MSADQEKVVPVAREQDGPDPPGPPLLLVMLFPQIALWFPGWLFNR